MLQQLWRNMHEKRTYLSWLLSYLLFLAVFIFMVILIFIQSKSILKSEILKANVSIINNMESTLDSIIRDIESLSFDIATDGLVLDCVDYNQLNQKEQYWDFYQVVRLLEQKRPGYNCLDDIGIYFLKSDKLLTVSGMKDAKFVYQDYLFDGHENTSFNDWKMLMKRQHKRDIYRSKQQGLLYLQSLPITKTGDGEAVLMMMINENNLYSIISSGGLYQDGIFMILNQYKDILFASKEHPFVEEIKMKQIQIAEGESELRVHGDTMVVYSTWSQNNNLQYVFSMPKKMFWFNMRYLNSVVFAISSVMALVGIVLAIYFSRRHYTPIDHILQMVKKENEKLPEENMNEFRYIEQLLHSKYKDVNRLRQEKESMAIKKLLVGYLNGKNNLSISDICKNYNITYDYPYYCVALLSIYDIGERFGTMEEPEEKEYQLVQFAVINILQELLELQGFHCMTFDLGDNTIFCRISAQEQQEQQQQQQKLRGILQQSIEFSAENLEIFYSASVSSWSNDPEQLRRLYQETLDLYAYMSYQDKNVAFYDEIQWANSAQSFSVEEENRLLNCIRTGAQQDALQIIEEILSRYALPQENLHEKLRYLKYDMISTMMKSARQLGANELAEQIGRLYINSSPGNLSTLKGELLQIVQQLCSYVAEYAEKVPQHENLGKQVMAYVQEHYQESDFGLTVLGEQFHLSPNYVSKLFKEQTGEVLRNYINSVRMEAAKQLLQNTDWKVKEICQKTGFIDLSAFMRAFKKYTGVAPGKYRDMGQK